MATLSHQRSAAGRPPRPVIGRVGSAMRLLTYHPQNLGAALDENLPLLLNSRCIDPVFRIVYSLSTCFRGGKNPVAASDGFVEHLLFWERIAAKVTYFISVI